MSEYQVINPATGQRGRKYPLITSETLEKVISAADAAYRSCGRASTVAERSGLLKRVGDLHRERRSHLAELAVEEVGKTRSQALGEVDFTADIYDYYAAHGDKFLQDEPIELISGTGSALVRRSPIGVLLGIMPWNYPYYQVARFAAPNLLLGNTVVLKHAPQCPTSSAAIEDLFLEAGLPEGGYTNIYASNDQIAEIIADPRIQGVSLTGSERAGASVAELAGRHLKKVVLELGGSDPFILLSTEDLDAVVECAVTARLDNNGQACNAAKRFLVAEDLYEPFKTRFAEALCRVSPGDPSLPGTFLGPVSSTAAADRLQEQLDLAVNSGATVLTGGTRSGTYFPGTILDGLDPKNPAYYEEFFGPIASIQKFSSEDEAVRAANDSAFGLGSYVFTTDSEQALRVADRLEVGMVFINGVGAESAELPFGGVKRSGFGRELGRYGVDEFANRKLIRTIG
ncbi:aldehyde dehydrogenase family protein [Pseudarthrobacter sp. AG30]|uniref:NAD-dependent succinate-semialdehyde dehydrogenase n=1 Tax=Pseudarthrobacter sp. AG30 TaxID=2249742 RepID=UPI000D6EA773|nr:NAD-dependent succinate-semialdehyde dehydrogenase [Pseudarthrobacter sp. AG30]RAX14912.1 aldehyde dehydrogenase family protein [Pseudarthrobacter sp. AG30]